MKLQEVLNNIDFEVISGDLNKEITSVEYDSRKVAIGSLFVCVQGFTVDGHSFASMAAEKGASAIVALSTCESSQTNGRLVVVARMDQRQNLPGKGASSESGGSAAGRRAPARAAGFCMPGAPRR